MSATQYQIFCRYYHSRVNRVVTNETDIKWIQAETPKTDGGPHSHTTVGAQYNLQPNKLYSKPGVENMWIRQGDEMQIYLRQGRFNSSDQTALNNLLRSYNTAVQTMAKRNAQIDNAMTQCINTESLMDNPKYDMMFIYDGVESCIGPEADHAEMSPASTAAGGTGAERIQEFVGGQDPPAAPSFVSKHTQAEVYYEKMKRIETTAPWFLYATCASLIAAMAKAEEIVKIMGAENVIIGKIVNLGEYIDID